MTTENSENGGSKRIVSIQEFGREVYRQAETARRDVARQLFDVADNIRDRAKGIEGDARDNAVHIAHNLEETASYLNGRAVDQVEDTTEMMRSHIWETTMIAFLVGLVVGLLLGLGNKD